MKLLRGSSIAAFFVMMTSTVVAQSIPSDGSVLPFPPTPSVSKARPTLQESVHKRRVEPDRLPKGAPNVLIVLIDDAGFGVPDTFGGFAHTQIKNVTVELK